MTEAPAAPASFDPKLFMDRVRGYGHGGALGIAYLDHGPDWCALTLPYDERLIAGNNGVLASGPIVSLMDMAASLSLWIKLGRFRHQATLDLRIEYLRPARPGAAIVGRGATNERAPQLTAKMPDHELWMAFVRDPDGNLVGLMSEVRK